MANEHLAAAEAPLVLEASTLVNLAASDEAPAIVDALGRTVVVCGDATPQSDRRGQDVLVQPDLRDLIDAQRLLKCVEPMADEMTVFVGLARTLDDVEALAVTVATQRAYDLASDDPKVRRTFVRHAGTESRLTSTAALLRWWVERKAIPPDRARATLQRITDRAHFSPPRDDGAYEWWAAVVA